MRERKRGERCGGGEVGGGGERGRGERGGRKKTRKEKVEKRREPSSLFISLPGRSTFYLPPRTYVYSSRIYLYPSTHERVRVHIGCSSRFSVHRKPAIARRIPSNWSPRSLFLSLSPRSSRRDVRNYVALYTRSAFRAPGIARLLPEGKSSLRPKKPPTRNHNQTPLMKIRRNYQRAKPSGHANAVAQQREPE